MPYRATAYALEIQDRDLEILRGLFESRVMTARHVAAIYFAGSYEAARKRLQKLKAAGYVKERPRRAYDPAVLFLTKKAFALLCEHGTINDYPHMTWKHLEKRVRVSPLTLTHELQVLDVKAAIAQALGTPLDLFQRIVINTCSVSAITWLGGGPPIVLAVNSTGASLKELTPA